MMLLVRHHRVKEMTVQRVGQAYLCTLVSRSIYRHLNSTPSHPSKGLSSSPCLLPHTRHLNLLPIRSRVSMEHQTSGASFPAHCSHTLRARTNWGRPIRTFSFSSVLSWYTCPPPRRSASPASKYGNPSSPLYKCPKS